MLAPFYAAEMRNQNSRPRHLYRYGFSDSELSKNEPDIYLLQTILDEYATDFTTVCVWVAGVKGRGAQEERGSTGPKVQK